MDARKQVEKIVLETLKRMAPEEVVGRSMRYDSGEDRLDVEQESFTLKGREVHLIGSGKASAAMASAVEEVLGNRLAGGAVITPKGTRRELTRIRLLEGTHPFPGPESLKATDELFNYVTKIPDGSLLLFLISGGSSALLFRPAEGITLDDLVETHRLLLDSGADIHEMNVVRTALSGIKGGQFLRSLEHLSVVDLIFSDVPGDQFRSIGSGPTTPGLISRRQALQIVQKVGLLGELPPAVRSLLKKEGEFVVQPHPGVHRQFLLASARKLADAVSEAFREQGVEVQVHTPAYGAPIEEVEQMMMSEIREHLLAGSKRQNGSDKPSRKALIWYGESSVRVTGEGKGGRNQELALRICRHLKPEERVAFLSLGTDGVDGPTDAAGALVDGETAAKAKKQGLDPDEFLSRNDSWSFFDQAGGLVRTGPTGNNLMDLQVALIG